MAILVIALCIATTIGLYFCARIPRSVLFWSAFVLSGTGGRARRTRRYEISRMQHAKCRSELPAQRNIPEPQQSNGLIVKSGFCSDRAGAYTS